MSKERDLATKKYATIKDIAQVVGTSVASVSAVLSQSDKRFVSPKLSAKILDAAKELNYIKSSMASGLKGINRRVIALLIPEFENSFFTRLAVGVENVARENDYTCFLCNTLDDSAQEYRIIENVIGHRVDGIILCPTMNGKENSQLIREYGIPYVVTNRPLVGFASYDYVTSDNYQAGVICAQELLSYNHQKIGFVGWKTDIPNVAKRQLGVQETVASSVEYYDSVLSKELSTEAGFRCTREILSKEHGITALVYGHHALVPGGIAYLREAGLRIPEDISVIMIGLPDWAHVIAPKFTCIYLPAEEMGSLAAQMLIERINGHRRIVESRILQDELIKGESVSYPRQLPE